MLKLIQGDRFIMSVGEGSQFTLPNGDVVSPAYAGWVGGPYTLIEAPVPEPEPLKPPTREEQEMRRQAAYSSEADPLFFKWQAGEGTEADWLAKRQEIRERYPYPTE